MKPANVNADLELAELVDQISALLEQGKRDEVDALIKAHPAHTDRLARILPTIEVLACCDDASAGFPLSSAADIAAHCRTLGDFRIVREIGRGGMGIVYEVEQLSLERRMALKVLPVAATLSVQQLERFKNEARLAASLKHPHIVSVHSVGVERGVHFYAMELVEGCSLAQAIAELSGIGNQTRTSPSEVSDSAETSPVAALSTARSDNPQDYFRRVAQLIADAADALDYAHAAGIVHRDIKPGNLLLDSDGKVHVTDFGLARLEADAGVTLTGDMLGTLRYMSPEQAAGKPGLIDYRTDIYALGATLYELLAMRPAFAGSDRAKLLRRIAEDTPPALRQFNARIPVDLATITAKTLEKEPADRYQSAADFAADLRAFLEHRTIVARPPSLPQRIGKWSRRHIAVTWTIAACVLVLSVLATWLVTKQVYEQQAISAAVESSLVQARAAMAANQLGLAQSAVEEAQRQSAQINDASSPLRRRIETLQHELTRYESFSTIYQRSRWGRTQANEFAREALEVYGVLENVDWADSLENANLPQAFLDRLNEQVYELLILLAHEKVLSFKQQSTNELNLKLVGGAQEFLSKASQLRVPTKGYYWVLAACSQRMGDLTKGEVRNHHDNEALRLRALAEHTPPQNAAEMYYISIDRKWGCADRGERELFRWPFDTTNELLAAYREMLRIEPDYYNALFFQSYWLMAAEKWDAALEGWNGCLVSRPDDFIAQHNRGLVLGKLGLYEESLIDLQHSAATAREKMEAEPNLAWMKVRYAEVIQDMAQVLHDAGKTAEARTHLSEARSVYERLAKEFPDNPGYAEGGDEVTKRLAELDSEPAKQPEDQAAAPTPEADKPTDKENVDDVSAETE